MSCAPFKILTAILWFFRRNIIMSTSARMRAVVALLLSLTIGLPAQEEARKPPKPTPQQMDKVDEAHRALFEPKPKPTEKASRYTNKVAASLPRAGGTRGKIQRKNLIDEHIFGRMKRDGIPHAGLSSDEEFFRRAYLDATGQLPPVEAVRKFLTDPSPQKRDNLIDSLVASDGFAEQWGWLWGDLFRVLGRSGDGNQGHLFHFWNKEWLRSDRPYNEVVHDLFTASAKSHS